MKMRKFLLIFFITVSTKVLSFQFGDSSFYLVDSLDLSRISPNEIAFIDSSLTYYHKEKDDSVKLSVINNMVENINDINVWPKYNSFLLGKINKQIGLKNKRVGEKYLKQLLAGVYNNIGYFHNENGRIKECLYYYNKALEIRIEINEQEDIGASLNNLGFIYKYQKDYKLALKYYKQALKIFKKSDNQVMVGYLLNNIGSIYKDQENYNEAKKMFFQSLQIHKNTKDLRGETIDLANLGGIFWKENKKDSALLYLKQANEIAIQINDKSNILLSAIPIANIYFSQEKFSEVDSILTIHLPTAIELNNPKIMGEISLLAYKNEKRKGNIVKALEHYENYVQLKDTILNINTKADAVRQNLKFEFEKQKALDEVGHQKRIAIDEKTKEKQRFIIYTVVGGMIIIFVFLMIIINRLKLTRKQKKVIDDAYNQLEEKNKEITDSIHYAKRIQAAILPPNKVVKEYLEESFILYKPKDIVAGDFYWLEHKDGKVLFAAADCTGHGVPGAMVSVVCNNGLNRSVREHGLTDPGEILNKTREIVVQEFEKSDEDVKDGMDIALCSIEGNTLKYAGANNPLWIIRNNEIIETSANKQPIGKFDNPEPYTTHTFELQKGDSIYIFSDGFVDQFGGEKGKKFKAKAFRELLLSIQDKKMEEQKIIIDEAFETWKGSSEQIDDVCVIGVRI